MLLYIEYHDWDGDMPLEKLPHGFVACAIHHPLQSARNLCACPVARGKEKQEAWTVLISASEVRHGHESPYMCSDHKRNALVQPTDVMISCRLSSLGLKRAAGWNVLDLAHFSNECLAFSSTLL